MEYFAIAFVIFICFAFYFLKRHFHRKKLAAIATGNSDVLLKWKYSPEEWARYAGDAASGWIKNKDLPGEAFITPVSIYVINGEDEYFYEFGYKRITQCTFLHSFLELRMEWMSGRVENRVQMHEDFRLLVPNAYEEEVSELVGEFKAMTGRNSRFALKFVEDNEITSLFGND
jgi:hypothetical protein